MAVQKAWSRLAEFGWEASSFHLVQHATTSLETLLQPRPLSACIPEADNRASLTSNSQESPSPSVSSPTPSESQSVWCQVDTSTAYNQEPCEPTHCYPADRGNSNPHNLAVLKDKCFGELAGFVHGQQQRSKSLAQRVSARGNSFSRGYVTIFARNPASPVAMQHSAATTPADVTPTPADVTTTSEESKAGSSLEAELAATAPSKTKADGTIGARFYKHVGVEEAEDATWRVTLDGRRLRSPAKRDLILPTRELALAIAAEWEWQDQKSIRPFTMPLMKLASTATDLVPLQRDSIIENLLKYFRTSDAVCVREPKGGALQQKQAEASDPLLEWMERELGVRPVTSKSIFGAQQPEAVVRRVQEALNEKSDFRLAAVDALASSAHSLVIALAVSRGHLGLRKALHIVRLEEDHQMDEWGLVEGGHDLDIADTQVRIAAPSIFLRLLNE